MAKDKPEYEENKEFNRMAVSVVEKYPTKFHGIEADKICCVNITNKTNPKKEDDQTIGDLKERPWKPIPVKMPIALHCPYNYYIVIFASDWNELTEKHKLAFVADVLHSIGKEAGQINPCDTKGYHSVFKTLGLDFLSDPDIPNILEEEVEWES